MWARIAKAIRARGTSQLTAIWVPSHSEEPPGLASDLVRYFHTIGNATADAWAGVAAQQSYDAALVGQAPPTDLHDA
eukprot:6329176-Pyramimonas_sp.AAC.1